jgi:hypothetical protein
LHVGPFGAIWSDCDGIFIERDRLELDGSNTTG